MERRNNKIRFFLCLILSISIFAIEGSVEDICAGKEIPACQIEISPLPIDLTQDSFDLMAKWTWISQRASQKRQLLKSELDEHKNMMRFIRDGKVYDDNSEIWHQNELKEIEKDFYDLKKITDHIRKYTNKINICRGQCSAQTRVEFEKEIQQAQSLKMSLLSKRPILASSQMEELLVENFDKDISLDTFKKQLKNSYVDYFKTLTDEIKRIDGFLNPVHKDYDFLISSRKITQEARQKSFLDKVSQTTENQESFINDLLQELNWTEEVQDPQQRFLACHYFKKHQDDLRNKKIISVATDTALIVGPFIVGPAFRLGAWGLRGTNLLKWGVAKESAARVSSLSLRALSGTMIVDSTVKLRDKKKACEKKLANFYQSSNRYDYYDYKDCVSDYQKDLAFSYIEAGALGLDGSIRLVKSLDYLKRFDRKKKVFHTRDFSELKHTLSQYPINGPRVGETGVRLRTQERGDFYVFNVGAANKSKDFSKVSDDYWDFVADIYNERLNLGDEEIKSFIKSSKQMADRTTLILNTKKGKIDKMNGGVALVASTKKAEQMPFEKATGFSVPREEGKRVAEIVRLSVGQRDPKLMHELLDLLKSSVAGERDIDRLYVYTSKKHARLYRKLGVPLKEIEANDRDVVFEINVEEYLKE